MKAEIKHGSELNGKYADVLYTNRHTGEQFTVRCKILRYLGKQGKRYYRVDCPNKGHSNVKPSQLSNISTIPLTTQK